MAVRVPSDVCLCCHQQLEPNTPHVWRAGTCWVYGTIHGPAAPIGERAGTGLYLRSAGHGDACAEHGGQLNDWACTCTLPDCDSDLPQRVLPAWFLLYRLQRQALATAGTVELRRA